jgi:hypothetical protein
LLDVADVVEDEPSISAESCRRTLAGSSASSSELSVLPSGNPDSANKRAVRF